MNSDNISQIKALADKDLYPAILKMISNYDPKGKVLDVPCGQGAFALELIKLGYNKIFCLDINEEIFRLKEDKRIMFIKHDVINPLPFPDNYFDKIFSIEGIEHFINPFVFLSDLCRVLKKGGRLILTTPNTFSIDARLKYLLSGYFPRFKPLMQKPEKLIHATPDDSHISPIYFWQLNFFLMKCGVSVNRISTNRLIYKKQFHKRYIEKIIAFIIKNNIKKRKFPNNWATSEEVLFGDCLIIEGTKL